MSTPVARCARLPLKGTLAAARETLAAQAWNTAALCAGGRATPDLNYQ